MKHKLTNIVTTLFLLTGSVAAYGFEAIGDSCEKKGYAVAYINGVNTSWADAYSNLLHLRAKMGIGDRFGNNQEPVTYELYYNTTASENSKTIFEKLVESWIKRNPRLQRITSQHWEVFRSFVEEGNNDDASWRSLREVYTEAVPEFGPFFSSFMDEYSKQSIEELIRLVANPPEWEHTARHITRVKALALEGKKIMMVAHSQGNVYVKPLYEAALSTEGFESDSISVLHLAPPNSNLNGPYLTVNQDKVISGLAQKSELGAVPSSNTDIPGSHIEDTDITGHSFVNTYMNPEIGLLAKVRNQSFNLMDRLRTPDTAGNPGLFTVTMIWDRDGDIDLHTIEPSGNQVYYNNKQGDFGYLDIDNTVSHGPEHYYTYCGEEQIGTGIYQIGVNNFRSSRDTKVTLQVSSIFDGVIYSKEAFAIGPQKGKAGNASPIPVIDVEVLRNGMGEYDVRVR